MDNPFIITFARKPLDYIDRFAESDLVIEDFSRPILIPMSVSSLGPEAAGRPFSSAKSDRFKEYLSNLEEWGE